MRTRWTSSTAISLLSAATLACGDSTGPDPEDLVDVLLDFCASDTPVFFAYQNQGVDWVRVTPDAQGTFAFQAGPTFAVAIVRQFGSDFVSEYLFATPDDVAPLNGQSCAEPFGTKSLSGSVSGVPVGSAAMITMANSFAYPIAPTASFTLSELPTGPLDLVAHRELIGSGAVFPDRVIIRRAQDRTSGSAIPVLDFNSNEAQAATSHTFTTSGLSGSDDTEALLTFSTSTTKRHSLSEPMTVGSGAQTIHGIPAALTQSGDFHELEVFANAGSAYRAEVQYYRSPSNRSVSLGASLNNPTLTTVATSPQLRLRTQLTSQAEYGGFVSVSYLQNSREVFVTVTSGYTGGTPTVWDITNPDLSGVSGFPAGARLQSGAGTDWSVDAFGGSGGAAAFFGAPADGAILHSAGRSFTTSAVQRTRASDRSSPLTPRRGLGGR